MNKISRKKDYHSLIMCTTPLQMVIAERIIKINPSQSFDLLVVSNQYNEKFQFYYEKLGNFCIESGYYQPLQGVMSYLDISIQFSRFLKEKNLNKNYDCLYLASIDSIYFQYILSVNPSANILTFDDGTANITDSSIYKKPAKNRYIKRVLSRLLGVRYDMAAIKSNSELHYTIYNDVPNIIDKTQFIKLYDEKRSVNLNSKKQVKKIFLGQPLDEISRTLEDLDIVKLLNVLDIDYYFPHPREQLTDLKNVEIIYSNLIIEDFIIDYLKNNPDIEIDVYSFISTANLNIASIEGVNSRFIYNSLIYQLNESFYSLAKEKFNVPIIQLD